MRKSLIYLLVALLLVIPLGVSAQDLTATYTAPDGSFAFDYPADWELDAAENHITLTAPDGLIVGVLNPDVVSRVGANLSPAETLDLLLNFTNFPASAVTDTVIGEYEAARASFQQSESREVITVAFRYTETNTGLVLGLAPVGQLEQVEPVVLAVAQSLRADVGVTAEATPAAEATAAVSFPAGVLYQDDFEAGLNPDWNGLKGMPEVIADGDNHVLRVGSDVTAYLNSGADWTDYAVELKLKVTVPTDIDALIGLRFDPELVALYGAYFSTPNGRIGLAYFNSSDNFKVLSTSRATLSAGQWYNMRLQAQGNRIELYINNHLTNWITSSQFSQGTLAVYTAPGAEIVIDDLVVRDLRE